MTTFERTDDMQLVREILTDTRVWRRMTDDTAPAPESFVPSLRDKLMYVIARRGERVVGLFVLVVNVSSAEVHFCITPESWGRSKTVRIGRDFVQWVWRETLLSWLIGPVPEHNRLARKLAEECGFTKFAEERGCVTKDGRKYARILMQQKRPGNA